MLKDDKQINRDKEGIEQVEKPLVVSVCGTYLKLEMQSIYRQIANLKKFRTIVLSEQLQNVEKFPFDEVMKMTKFPFPRPKGNFILRFWFKYILKKWPPPRPINKLKEPYYHYNLHTLLTEKNPELAHIYYGHKAVKYHEMLKVWGGKWIVSFHGVDVAKFMDQKGYPEKMKAMLDDASLVLARSKSLLKEIEKLGCPKEKLRLNCTPIPMDLLNPRVVELPENGEVRVLQACRLVEKKGIKTALHALRTVVQIYPRLRYIIAGEGPSRNCIEGCIKELGLDENVILLGWISPKQLVKQFNKAHIFMHPSESTSENDQEGIPNSLIEAMASGLPILATTHGGIPEAVTSEYNGILVAEKNPDQLAQALINLLTNQEKVTTISKNAIKSARENFELHKHIKTLEGYYQEVVNINSDRNNL